VISTNNIEFRRDFLSSLLSNFTKIFGFGLTLVFITHVIFFSDEYSVSTAQILQGLSGFTLLYISAKGITKKFFDSLLKEKESYLYTKNYLKKAGCIKNFMQLEMLNQVLVGDYYLE